MASRAHPVEVLTVLTAIGLTVAALDALVDDRGMRPGIVTGVSPTASLTSADPEARVLGGRAPATQTPATQTPATQTPARSTAQPPAPLPTGTTTLAATGAPVPRDVVTAWPPPGGSSVSFTVSDAPTSAERTTGTTTPPSPVATPTTATSPTPPTPGDPSGSTTETSSPTPTQSPSPTESATPTVPTPVPTSSDPTSTPTPYPTAPDSSAMLPVPTSSTAVTEPAPGG